MIALLVAGIIMVFNLVPALNLGIGSVNDVFSGFWFIIVKVVGLALIGLSIWVSVNVIKENM
jgi:hypothetical protein